MLVGIIGLHGLYNGIPEIGYMLNADYWGKRYATEAVKGCLATLLGAAWVEGEARMEGCLREGSRGGDCGREGGGGGGGGER